MILRTLLATVMLASVTAAETATWPQFRGPAGNSIATTGKPPLKWDASTSVAWATELPGDGWSSPVVVGERVFLTSAVATEGDAYRYEVHCLDLSTGEKLWTRVAATAPPRVPIHRDNSYATETAASDGERVVAYFGMQGCFCYSLDGEPLWQRDLGAYEVANDWGASSSPVIADGLVCLQIDNEEKSHVVALDLPTGEQRWRADRPDEGTNWCSPIVWRNSRRTELVTGGTTVRSYEVASGIELWSMPIGGRSAATPSTAGDTLIIGSENRTSRGGTPGGLFAVAAGAAGELDVFDADNLPESVRWANHRGGIGISSPLVYDGLIYAPGRRSGVVNVHDITTGEIVNKGRLRGAGTLWASPWAASGRLFFLDEKGKTLVLKPGADLNVVGENTLPGRFWSTPAIAGDRLLVRSQTKLFCIE